MEQLKIELTSREMEKLQQVHNATALRELRGHPGWVIYSDMIADMLARLENQHLNFARNASRDAYWANGLRLSAVREFAQILQEKIVTQIDLLNQPLNPERASQPEGDE